jgi:hypothetical protein
MKPSKIFGIGFHKTGTSSLGLALTQLGYHVTGPNGAQTSNMGYEYARQLAFQLVDEGKFDSFKDNPWPLLYRELDERYPHSKFILTIRPTEDWIKSVVRYFDTKSTPMRTWIYGVGSPKGHESIYRARYEKHNEEVMSYFQHRPNDLLVLRITEGDGWEKLCSFLNQKIPSIPFPDENKASTVRPTLRNE